jgi:hypothetical protein
MKAIKSAFLLALFLVLSCNKKQVEPTKVIPTSVSTCNSPVSATGGFQAEIIGINLSANKGKIDFYYKTYGQPDRLVVSYENKVLFDTKCISTEDDPKIDADGFLKKTLEFNGSSKQIIVKTFSAECGGAVSTEWEFKLSCPY